MDIFKLNKSEIILLLYLLHYPDYPSEIARNLGKAGDRLKKVRNLAISKKVSSICKKLERDGFLKQIKYKPIVGRPKRMKIFKGRRYYILNPLFFSKTLSQLTNLGSHLDPVVTIAVINFIRNVGIKEEQFFIDRLFSYKNYNFITILAHLKNTIIVLSDFCRLNFKITKKNIKEIKSNEQTEKIKELYLSKSFLNLSDTKNLKNRIVEMGNELGYKPFRSSIKFIPQTFHYRSIDEKGKIIKKNEIRVRIPKISKSNVFDEIIRFINSIMISYAETKIITNNQKMIS
jgi:hypothetical protein